jgi:serine/threonine-protein kinase
LVTDATDAAPAPDPKRPLPRAPVERPRVALATGQAAASSSDPEQLLRKRLLAITLSGALIMGLHMAIYLPLNARFMAPDPVGWFRARFSICGMIVTVAVWAPLAYFLRYRPGLSMGRLRWLEGGVFAMFAALCCADTCDVARRLIPDAIPPGVTLANGTLLPWFACILVYGILIPNTARRCLLVVGLIALAGASSMIGAWLWNGAAPDEVVRWMVNVISWLGIAMSITVTGAHWLEKFRRQAREARQLGQYSLGQRLGAGGMGEVYLAQHLLLRRPCAIKVIRPERAGDPKNQLRFEREVQATTRLTHPAAVQVYDYGHTEDGRFFYAMEYLSGFPLDDLVARTGPLPPGRVVAILRQVCGALEEAHALGLVHRDVKPGNVMLCRIGRRADAAKLLDFGLVQDSLTAEDVRLTQEGGLVGTPAYMSPEQARGADVGPASDLYSLGAVGYFLLTGRPPFQGKNALGTLQAHLTAAVVPPSAVRPGAPADLDAVIVRLLAKAPGDRYVDATAVAAALAGCACAADWTDADAAAWWEAALPQLASGRP